MTWNDEGVAGNERWENLERHQVWQDQEINVGRTERLVSGIAGVVLGARVPIVLTSRADDVRARLASCAIAALMAHARRTASPVAIA